VRYLLDAVYLILVLICAPILLRAKTRRGLWPRFLGRTRFAASGELTVWFHGVSVGEIHLLRNVVKRFRERRPDARCVVSSTTETGFAEAQKCFPGLVVIRWPLDFSWAVERALREVRPDAVVLAESELWPNFLLAAKRRGVPVVAINVRLSPRSLRRYRLVRSLAGRWLRLVSYFAAQTENFAAALCDLGVDPRRVSVTGSVKYDGVAGDRDARKTRELGEVFGIGRDEIVWIAGSTQAPEEEIALGVYQRLNQRFPKLRLILVPRQRERFDDVAALLIRESVPFMRRSKIDSRHSVILLDTIGELSAAWGLADVAFVGGSLDGRRGGQNMIEPAAYGAAVLFGPHTWNFRDPVERLLAAKAAIVVRDAAEMEQVIARLLADADECAQLGKAAARLVRAQQGATERTLKILDDFLPARSEGPRHVSAIAS
jgi:3-deoxy-D-manno-octulosonic-acid transferase